MSITLSGSNAEWTKNQDALAVGMRYVECFPVHNGILMSPMRITCYRVQILRVEGHFRIMCWQSWRSASYKDAPHQEKLSKLRYPA